VVFLRSDDSLVVRSRFTKVLTEYPLETRGRRALTHLKQHGRLVTTLPSAGVPTCDPKEDIRTWVSRPGARLNSVPASSPPPLPQTFADFVSVLDPALSALLSDVEMLLPLAEIGQLLATSSTLTLVGDGGSKTCRGSYGAVAALDSIRILQVKGPVTGPDPRSYRAKAHAMATIILCMVILHKVAPHHDTSYKALAIFSDNQGLVDKIKEMMEWETFYPSAALLSEWGVLSVILEYIPQLPTTPVVQHIKGHQDKEAPVASLSLQAQLNCEAGALATIALIAITAPIPKSPVFPSAACQLDIADASVSRKIPASLRFSAAEPAMTEYLRDRNAWDEETFESVSWPAFSAARFTTPNSKFDPKFCHHHLPVGDKANRNDSKYSPCCPACSTPCESNEHFLVCNAPSHLQWRQQFLVSIKKELTRLYTSPLMATFLMETIDRLLDGKIISCTGTFHEIAQSQQHIGWMIMFCGF
jgi:hypothetical protein